MVPKRSKKTLESWRIGWLWIKSYKYFYPFLSGHKSKFWWVSTSWSTYLHFWSTSHTHWFGFVYSFIWDENSITSVRTEFITPDHLLPSVAFELYLAYQIQSPIKGEILLFEIAIHHWCTCTYVYELAFEIS